MGENIVFLWCILVYVTSAAKHDVEPGFRNDISISIGIPTVRRPISQIQAQAQTEEFFPSCA